ncbi:MAG: hypothetical protein JSS10_07440 [Verrucomicrobia bacterium]|nr:hypothetical protein [Verrucomicrobiota bacterium]
MSKSKKCLIASLILLTGCASYSASTLATLPADSAVESPKNSDILVSWKAFDVSDCKRYLGRNVISEGYMPLQLTIRNNSTDPVYFNPQNFNIPLASVNEVASKAHTSTAGRVVGWGVGALFIFPLVIPAIYDGIKSSEANDALDADYEAKALREHIIQPLSTFNGVVFVPQKYSYQNIEMFLVNQKTHEKIVFKGAGIQ